MAIKYTILTIIAFLIGIGCGWNGGKDKQYTVKGTLQDWSRVWKVVDTSAASNLEVRWVKEFINSQIKNQTDTTKVSHDK